MSEAPTAPGDDAAVAPPSGPPPTGLAARLRARRSALRHRGRLRVERGATLGPGVVWDLAADARVVLGAGCAIGAHTRVHVTGGEVRIGPGAVLGERCVLQSGTSVTIGRDALLADEVVVLDHRPVVGDPDVPLRLQGVERAPVTVGDRSRIGSRAVLGAGARIAPGARVGSGVVVEGTDGAPAPRG